MTLQRISLPNEEFQAPLSTTPKDITRGRSLQQQTVDYRIFKFDYCHRGDARAQDRISVVLCGDELAFIGIDHSVLDLNDCYQHNLTVESYLNAVGYYERQQRAWLECDLRDESKQSFCTQCPQPDAISVRAMGDDNICNVVEEGCLQPCVRNFISNPESIVRCGTNGTIVVYASGGDDHDGWGESLDTYMPSCDEEDRTWNRNRILFSNSQERSRNVLFSF